MAAGDPVARSAPSEFLFGVGLLGRGGSLFARSPGMLVLGVVPALITLILVAGALGVLLYFIGDLSALVTWFADDWSETARTAARAVAGVTIVTVAALLSVFMFVAVTLVIGDPFYEQISKRIEDRVGGAPSEADIPWYRTILWNLVDSLRLVGLSVGLSVPLFLAGMVPVVGQTVVPVVDVIVGGWLIALEITGIPFNRRGLRLADRRRLLRARRALALGLGIPVFLLLMVPFVGVIVMPVAIAGSTLLARKVLGLPIDPALRDQPPRIPTVPTPVP